MTRKDLNQIYDLMEKLDNIKLDQEFIEKVSDKGYDPFEVILRFKYPNKNEEATRRKLDITQECVYRIYDLIKKDISIKSKKCLIILMGW